MKQSVINADKLTSVIFDADTLSSISRGTETLSSISRGSVCAMRLPHQNTISQLLFVLI